MATTLRKATKIRIRLTGFMLATAMVMTAACNKDESGSGSTNTSFATIYVNPGAPPSLIPDGGAAIYHITETAIDKKELTHQRRVVATYTLLRDVTPEHLADISYWNIRLDQITDLACKPPIYRSQTEEPDQLGTGMIRLKNIWIAGQYLNIEYEHAGEAPAVNLWFDDSHYPVSDTWVTTFCIHNPTAVQRAATDGHVSFDMSQLFENKRKYHYKLTESAGNGYPYPTKLIFRYYDSADRIATLHYTLELGMFGFRLIPEPTQE